MDHCAPKTIRFGLTVSLRFARTGSLIMASVLVSACDQGGPGSFGNLTTTIDTIDTIDGVIRVTNTGTPPEWQLTQVVSIGPKTLAVGDGGPEEFGRVSSASLGPDEAVFVADAGNREIRVFGLDGVHRRILAGALASACDQGSPAVRSKRRGSRRVQRSSIPWRGQGTGF